MLPNEKQNGERDKAVNTEKNEEEKEENGKSNLRKFITQKSVKATGFMCKINVEKYKL